MEPTYKAPEMEPDLSQTTVTNQQLGVGVLCEKMVLGILI